MRAVGRAHCFTEDGVVSLLEAALLLQQMKHTHSALEQCYGVLVARMLNMVPWHTLSFVFLLLEREDGRIEVPLQYFKEMLLAMEAVSNSELNSEPSTHSIQKTMHGRVE